MGVPRGLDAPCLYHTVQEEKHPSEARSDIVPPMRLCDEKEAFTGIAQNVKAAVNNMCVLSGQHRSKESLVHRKCRKLW